MTSSTPSIGDHQELYQFAATLQNYLERVMEETGRLDAAFNQLGDSWRDGKRREFEEVFQQLRGALNSFHEQASQQIPHLNQLAQHLENYQNT